MSEQEIGALITTLGVFMCAVHLMGYVFERLRQPRLVGEIIAGILLGPAVLGNIWPEAYDFLFKNSVVGEDKTKIILGYVYWLGVLFLMFLSGSQVRGLLSAQNRRETAWLVGVGTPIPFLLVMGLGLASLIPLDPLVGVKGVGISALLILATAVAVTSIPVISRIFSDLGILHTRFASLILGSAVLEDIALWGVLAIATALAGQTGLAETGLVGSTASHLLLTLGYTATALIAMPTLLRHVRRTRWNLLLRASRTAYVVIVLFAYVGLAAILGVNLVFAAFLAGFGIAGGASGTERVHFAEALDAIKTFAQAALIPVYFALVGYRLVFGREFSMTMLVAFFVGSSLLALISVGLAARLAGFRGLDVLNLAITTNARGGPGIVLASVAYDGGIISPAFYTTLVLTAIFTSQAAGLWLRYVLGKGWPLLSTDPEDGPLPPQKAGGVAAGPGGLGAASHL